MKKPHKLPIEIVVHYDDGSSESKERGFVLSLTDGPDGVLLDAESNGSLNVVHMIDMMGNLLMQFGLSVPSLSPESVIQQVARAMANSKNATVHHQHMEKRAGYDFQFPLDPDSPYN